MWCMWLFHIKSHMKQCSAQKLVDSISPKHRHLRLNISPQERRAVTDVSRDEKQTGNIQVRTSKCQNGLVELNARKLDIWARKGSWTRQFIWSWSMSRRLKSKPSLEESVDYCWQRGEQYRKLKVSQTGWSAQSSRQKSCSKKYLFRRSKLLLHFSLRNWFQ